jgi:hypothetical protein
VCQHNLCPQSPHTRVHGTPATARLVSAHTRNANRPTTLTHGTQEPLAQAGQHGAQGSNGRVRSSAVSTRPQLASSGSSSRRQPTQAQAGRRRCWWSGVQHDAGRSSRAAAAAAAGEGDVATCSSAYVVLKQDALLARQTAGSRRHLGGPLTQAVWPTASTP